MSKSINKFGQLLMDKEVIVLISNKIVRWLQKNQLSKQQALNADTKAIQQISFTGNLDRAKGAWMVLILEKVK